MSFGIEDVHPFHQLIIVAGMSNVFFRGAIAWFAGGSEFFKALLVPWLCSLAAGALLLAAR